MKLGNVQTIIRSIGLACGFVLSLNVIKSNAQLYPVQITPQLVPPYSVYLSDYAAPGSEKLRVIILQRDLTKPSYQLRLVMSIEWNGKVIIRTAKNFNPKPLNIDPGIPTIISGADLAPYVDTRNIDFVGYSREQYERTRTLPEGSYRIIFTAYDYRRQDVQVSNVGSSFYYLSKNEPPLINFPVCGISIPKKDPQQIVFSWLPRNTSSPTSAADTEYEFTLYETRPAGRNPNDVINTTQPVFRTKIDATTLVYGPTEPILFENMKYVWRVRAIDKSGRDAFRNNGFSEVCTFTYGGADAAYDIGVVKNLQAVGETETRAKISWEAKDYDSYKVYYRKRGTYAGSSTPYEWFSSSVTTNELKLFGLQADTEYETRVQVKKSGVFGQFSETVKFRTLQKQVADCKPTDIKPARGDESKPLQAAQTGMTVDVDGMFVTLEVVESLGGGWFKGTGTTSTKLLASARFYVKFDRLFIDENLIAGKGRIDVVSKGVADLVKQQMANTEKNKILQQQQANRDKWSGTVFQEKIFKCDIPISDVFMEDDIVTIMDSDGNTTPNPSITQLLIDAPEKAIIIEDKNGDQWVVQKDENGEEKITKVPGGGLVVGSDGTIVDTRTLSGLYSKILKALRKYQKAIDEYQASIEQTQPGKGGGPSLFEDEIALLAELPQCLAPYKDQIGEVAANVKMYSDSGSTESIKFITPVSRILATEFPTEAERINASYENVEEAVCEALTPSWIGSETYKYYHELFAFIYDKNHRGLFSDNMTYLEEIEKLLSESSKQVSINLNYKGHSTEVDKWINSWKIRVSDSKVVTDNIIKVIQNAGRGEKIGEIFLKPKYVYINKYKYNGNGYPIAIYNAGYSEKYTNAFTKVEISEYDQWRTEENMKRMVVEEVGGDYFFVSFFENGQQMPTLIIQVQKLFFDDSMEEWLKFLGILVEQNNGSLPNISLAENVTFYGYDENDPKGCFRRATDMLKSAGFSPVGSNDSAIVQMTKYDESGELVVQDEIANGLPLIDRHLDAGKPIIVGVDYVAGHTGNVDKTTDHWVIIVARKTINGNVCYRYFDPQASQQEVGASAENLLCKQADGTLIGRYRKGSSYDRIYTVTMVRPSIEN